MREAVWKAGKGGRVQSGKSGERRHLRLFILVFEAFACSSTTRSRVHTKASTASRMLRSRSIRSVSDRNCIHSLRPRRLLRLGVPIWFGSFAYASKIAFRGGRGVVVEGWW